MKLAIPNIIDGDWNSVRIALQKLASLRLGSEASPIFASLILNDLTASKLLATDADKSLSSVANLASWIAGTIKEIEVTDNKNGTITISLTDIVDFGNSI